MERSLNKKGIIRFSEAPSVILLFVIVGIFLAVGIVILTEVQDTQKTTAGVRTIVNESHTVVAPVQGNNFTLDEVRVDFSGTLVNIVVSNTSVTNNTVNLVDFTFGSTTGVLTVANSTPMGTIFNVTYDFTETEQNVFFNATGDVTEGLATISSFTPIIAVVVSAAIIIGIVFLINV